MSNKPIVSTIFVITFLAILGYGVIKWLQIPAGSLIDWVVGIAAFWWLSIVTTVPWNTYFQAKEVLQEAIISKEKDIKVREEDVLYAKGIAHRFLITAIGLHIISAIALAAIAYFEISPIGYWGAGLALLMTGLRPSARWYEYIVARLYAIRQEIKYPRDDAYELKQQVETLKNQVEQLEYALNMDKKDSFAAKQNKETEYVKNTVQNVRVELDKLKVQNAADHDRLAKKSEESLAKLTEDAQFLNQVRDLIRFIKSA